MSDTKLIKQAEIKTKLQPHQQEALKRALTGDVILAHSLGSGKTLTSIAIADALNKPTTVFTPASLVANYLKEIKKHKKGGPPIDVISLPTAVLRDYKVPEGNTVILDEAHTFRNPDTRKYQYMKEQLADAGRVVALTGTPAYNNLSDWGPLANLVARKKLVPDNFTEFKKRYIREIIKNPSWWQRLWYNAQPSVTEKLKNAEELHEKLAPYVHMYDAEVEKPKRIDETITVDMTKDQEELYNYVVGSLPPSLRWKLKMNLAPSKQEAKFLNAFLTGARQVSNTPEEYQLNANPGKKIRVAAKNLIKMYKNDPGFRALVYSNYIGSGLSSYGRMLTRAGIPYAKFTGNLTPEKKKKVVEDYNAGKVPVILGSGSASEGLDLKNTKLIQLLDPHFNNSRLEQVIGRGIRYKSHDSLPPDKRKVLVQHYLSTLPSETDWLGRPKPNASVDQYLTSRSEEKDQLIKEFKEALKGWQAAK